MADNARFTDAAGNEHWCTPAQWDVIYSKTETNTLVTDEKPAVKKTAAKKKGAARG